MIIPGQAMLISETVYVDGIPAAPDSITAVLYRIVNGVRTASGVTVTHSTTANTGEYTFAWTNDGGWNRTDDLELRVIPVIDSQAYPMTVWRSHGHVDAVMRGTDSANTTAPDNAGIAAIQARTDNLPSDPADASDIAASFGSVTSALNTIAGYIDTQVAAIKAKTDNLPADPATETTLATLDGLIDAIKVITDQITFTSGLVDANATATIDGADIRSAVGLVAANLDTQLSGLDSAVGNVPTATEISDRIERNGGPLKKLESTLEDDGDSGWQFTELSLENAPASGGVVGPGGVAHPIRVTSNGNPVDGAEVWVTTDEAGNHVIAGPLYTNSNGWTPNFMLDPDDYFAWAQRSEINIQNPTPVPGPSP